MKAKELRDLSNEELELQYNEMHKKRYELLNEFKLSKKVETPHRLQTLRKDIARVLTIQNERKKQTATT